MTLMLMSYELHISVFFVCVCVCVYLIVNALPVQGDVDGEGGGVVVRPQRRLLVRTVTHHKIHDGLSLNTPNNSLVSVTDAPQTSIKHTILFLSASQ